MLHRQLVLSAAETLLKLMQLRLEFVPLRHHNFNLLDETISMQTDLRDCSVELIQLQLEEIVGGASVFPLG